MWPVEIGHLPPLRRPVGGAQGWKASDPSGLDLLVIQIDGIHMDEDLILVTAIGVDAKGDKHPLGLIEGATENGDTQKERLSARVREGWKKCPTDAPSH